MREQQGETHRLSDGFDPVGPFGNPDGSRASIERVLHDFVDFHGDPAFGALATRADDATSRVIVGRLGAGKTVYLRRLRSFQAQQESVYADQPQQDPPSTETIVKACQYDCSTVSQDSIMGYS